MVNVTLTELEVEAKRRKVAVYVVLDEIVKNQLIRLN